MPEPDQNNLESVVEQTTIVINSQGFLVNSKNAYTEIGGERVHAESVHADHLRNVLTYDRSLADIVAVLSENEIRFSLKDGFHGNGFDSLEKRTKGFLNEWAKRYIDAYRQYRHNLKSHDEIKNYREVMKGALQGVVAGAGMGICIDACANMYHPESAGWEITARSTPAVLEALGIASPFFGRLKEWADYKLGKTKDKPEPFTSTEIWALTQLAGPIIGFAMLAIGEMWGWNDNPAYRATAVFTVNTGNNVIGSGSSYLGFFRESRKMREMAYRELGKPNIISYMKELKEDMHMALCNFWMDSFQSSNVMVASAWYGAELGLRSMGIAAENVNFSGGLGGKTVAALESALLSCDTAAAAKLAMIREQKKLYHDVKRLTDKTHLDEIYKGIA